MMGIRGCLLTSLPCVLIVNAICVCVDDGWQMCVPWKNGKVYRQMGLFFAWMCQGVRIYLYIMMKEEEVLPPSRPILCIIMIYVSEPCDYSEIQIAEQKMMCRFPADLRCSLQIHNGQQMGNGNGLGSTFNCIFEEKTVPSKEGINSGNLKGLTLSGKDSD